MVSNVAGNTAQYKGFTNGVLDGSPVGCGTGGSGTLTVNSMNGWTPTMFNVTQAINSSIQTNWFAWQTAVQSYTRPSGMNPIKVRWYEGAIEATAFSAAQYTTAGIVPATVTPTCTTHGTTTVDSCSSMIGIYKGMVVSATDITSSQTVTAINVLGNSFTLSAASTPTGATETVTVTGNGTASANAVNDAILAWKNDPSAATTMKYYYQGFMGTDTNQITSGLMASSASPSNLVLTNGTVWSLYPGGLTSTPYKLYSGVCSFNGGSNC